MSFIKMERGWHDSEFFGSDMFSERDAWSWMIAEAKWKDGTYNILKKPTFLKRGQFSHSIRFMAEKFQWSVNRVQRFLKRLEMWQMVNTATDTGQIIITICNYSKYQSIENQTDTDTDTQSNTPPDTGSDTKKKKDQEGKEVLLKKEPKAREELFEHLPKTKKPSFQIPDWIAADDWNDLEAHRKKLRKPLTDRARKEIIAKLEKFRQQGFSPHDLISEMIEKGWLTVYEPKGKEHESTGKNHRKSKSEQLDDILAEYRAEQGLTPSAGTPSDPGNAPTMLRPVQHLRPGSQGPEEHVTGIRGGLVAVSDG